MEIKASTFETFWKSNFGEMPPLGHRLRHMFPERWVRFHALPNSKRYAENDAERDIILERGNILAEEVLGRTIPCWLLASQLMDKNNNSPYLSTQRAAISEWGLQKSFLWVDSLEEAEDQAEHQVFGKSLKWKMGRFDGLLTKIADDGLYNFLWMSSTTAEIFKPYDGGFDLILKNKGRVKYLTQKYAQWMSVREDGL